MVNVDQLPKAEEVRPGQSVPQAVRCGPTGKSPELVGSSSSATSEDDKMVIVAVEDEFVDEEAPLLGMGECRICQDEDSFNNLESPCACSGSLKVNVLGSFLRPVNVPGSILSFLCGVFDSSLHDIDL